MSAREGDNVLRRDPLSRPPEPGPPLEVETHVTSNVEWWLIRGRECTVGLAPRPPYCNRGNFIATLDAWGELGTSIDRADGWPRYYFDRERALLEIEAWLVKRGQVS